MSETAAIGLAVWGAGAMGERVARTAARVPDLRVAAVIDRDADRAASLAHDVGARGFTTLAEACGNRRVDAVYIGLPNGAHHEACLDAARQSVHVLVDKPLTPTLAEAREVLDAAGTSGRFWMMGFSYRFRAEWQRAREILAAGTIGEPYAVSDDVIEAYATTPDWYWSVGSGGGTLRLQSHHVLDRWEWALERTVSSISARRQAVPGWEADRAVALTARFDDDITASSVMSFGVGYDAVPHLSFTVQGTRGMIRIDGERVLTVATAEGTATETHANDWLHDELSAFVSGIRGDRAEQPSLAAGYRAVQLAEAAALSDEERRWVSTAATDESEGEG